MSEDATKIDTARDVVSHVLDIEIGVFLVFSCVGDIEIGLYKEYTPFQGEEWRQKSFIFEGTHPRGTACVKISRRVEGLDRNETLELKVQVTCVCV